MRKFFSLLAAVLFAGSMMAAEAILQYTGGVTANMVGDGANNAATLGLDEDLFTVLADKGANQNLPGLNKNNDIRLYADKNSGNGNTITVSIASGTITSIVLDIKQTATFVVKAGETAVTEENGAYAINAASFSIQNTTTGATTQLQLNKITITYESGDVPPTPTMAYYVAGSMTNWGPMPAYKLAANPANEGEYMGEFTFAANDEFKVAYSDGTTIESTNYFPNGMDNNYVITEAGDYTVYFRPDGQGGEGWHEGYINAVKKVIPQYEVAEAIAAGLADNTEILVRGVITKIEFKGKNFAKYGSVNIYVADATNAEGQFEFYNCYSLNADTFRTSTPAYDAESNAWVEFEEVVDKNGNAVHVGDTVIAFGKYKLYNETHELNTGCYLTEIKHSGDAPVVDVWDEIVFTEVAAAGVFNDSIFTVEGSEFSLKCVDTENSKLKTTSNNASFGSLDERHDYTIRLQTSGKSNSKNNMELNIPADGKLRIAVRTGSSSDLTRTLVLAQGNDTICNKILLDTDTVPGASSPKIFNFIYVDVKAGKVAVTYPVNAINFYSFAFKAELVPPTPEHTYTVAGSSDVLFGTTWDPANTANDMALVEGLYTWEKSELTLAAGNILFKVCEDHAWTTAYPAQNYELNIPEAGIYTITITFDPANDNAVNAVATKTGEAVVIPTVAMHGNFLGSWADTENFAIAQDNASASLTLTLAEGDYEFGMRIGGSGNWTANGANLTREANTTNLAEGSGNMHIAADVAGDYVFTYTYETQVLEVVYPEAPVVPDTIVIDIESEVQYTDYVAQAGWWQFMADNDEYSISISNVSTTQAAGTYTIADLDADYTYLFRVADSTKIHFVAGSFVLTEGEDGSRTIEGVVTGDDEKIYSIKLVFRIPTAETTVNVEIPKWGVADAAQIYSYTGTVFYGEAADSTYIQFVVLGNNPIGTFTYDDMLPTATGIEVGGEYKAIYSMDVTVNASDAQRAIVTADILCYNNTLYHVTTHIGEGINAVEAAQKAVKMIQNGQVVIIKNGVHYNINGAVIR